MTPTYADPIEVVRAHYDAIKRRDRVALLATLHDDVDWELAGPSAIPFAGRWHGLEGAKRFFSIIGDTVEVLEFAVDDIIAAGNKVVALGHEHFRVKATGRDWSCGWVQVHSIADGKIRTFREFTDTAAISAAYQQQSLKESLVGTWTAVSWEQKKSDGTTLRQFGANPTGVAFFDAGGRYIITVMRSDRAGYPSNALWQGTAEENKATADGTMTYFGTYSVSELERSIAIHIDGSSFPNWNGADQKRLVAIAGDQLTLTVRPPSGEDVEIIWKRAK